MTEEFTDSDHGFSDMMNTTMRGTTEVGLMMLWTKKKQLPVEELQTCGETVEEQAATNEG